MITKEAYEEQLAKAKEFHGEVCGGIAIGTKLAMYGMDLMGLELNTRHKNLMVFVEIAIVSDKTTNTNDMLFNMSLISF